LTIVATVLVPTFDHGPDLLGPALDSALAQTVSDIEVLVVGDGAPPGTEAHVTALARRDGRVRWAGHPKGPRHGEAYRHPLLLAARGRIVCYLSDDDLFLADHVETMSALLEDADFAHTLPTRVEADGRLATWNLDLTRDFYRRMLLSGSNRLPFTAAAHTAAFYRSLPHGWRTTPAGTPTDLYMWQQILAQGGCRVANAMRTTCLHFPSPLRKAWPAERRAQELGAWVSRLAAPGARERLGDEVHEAVARDRARLEDEAAGRERATVRGMLRGAAVWTVRRLSGWQARSKVPSKIAAALRSAARPPGADGPPGPGPTGTSG